MADNKQYIDWAKTNISGWDSLSQEKQNAVIQKRMAEVWAENNISNWAGIDKEKRNKIINKRLNEGTDGKDKWGDTGIKLQNTGLPFPIPTLGSIPKDVSFSSGILSGLTAGLYEPKIPEEIGERSGYKTAGNIIGTLAPISGINKAVSGAKVLLQLPKFARLALQGGIAGGTLGTAKEVGDITRGESFNVGDIGKEALAWSALEVGGGAIGNVIKKAISTRNADLFKKTFTKAIKDGKVKTMEQVEIDKIAKQVRTGELTDPSLRIAANDTKVASPNVPGQSHTFLDAPTVTRGELNVVMDIPVQKQRNVVTGLANQFNNPIYMHEKYGTKEIMYWPVRTADNLTQRGTKQINDEINQIVKKNFKIGTRSGTSKKIMTYAVAQQKGGENVLKEMGVTNIPNLNESEMEAYNLMRSNLERMYNEIQVARKQAGLSPFPKVDNYFTFMRTLEGELENGHTFESLSPNIFTKAKKTPFRFEKKRIIDDYGEVTLDAFNVYQRYMASAIKHKEFTPVVGKMRQILDGKFYNGFKLSESNPVAYKDLNNWVNNIAGVKRFMLDRRIEGGLRALNRNDAYAVLGGNLHSYVIQPTALVNAYTEMGPKWVAKGLKAVFSPKERAFAMSHSEHLFGRSMDVSILEATNTASKKLGIVRDKIGNKLLGILQSLDAETAKATWIGAYKKGTQKLGMDMNRAVKYADDIVIQTQASGSIVDRAPIQQHALGQTLTRFQTFVINDWNFMVKKILGVGSKNLSTAEKARRIGRYMVASQGVNFLFEDVLNTRSPFPDPIHAYIRSKNDGKSDVSAFGSAAIEFAEKIPIAGGVRYGSSLLGAGAQWAQDASQMFSDRITTEKKIETIGRGLGVPGTLQIKKLIRYKKRKDKGYKK